MEELFLLSWEEQLISLMGIAVNPSLMGRAVTFFYVATNLILSWEEQPFFLMGQVLLFLIGGATSSTHGGAIPTLQGSATHFSHGNCSQPFSHGESYLLVL